MRCNTRGATEVLFSIQFEGVNQSKSWQIRCVKQRGVNFRWSPWFRITPPWGARRATRDTYRTDLIDLIGLGFALDALWEGNWRKGINDGLTQIITVFTPHTFVQRGLNDWLTSATLANHWAHVGQLCLNGRHLDLVMTSVSDGGQRLRGCVVRAGEWMNGGGGGFTITFLKKVKWIRGYSFWNSKYG